MDSEELKRRNFLINVLIVFVFVIVFSFLMNFNYAENINEKSSNSGGLAINTPTSFSGLNGPPTQDEADISTSKLSISELNHLLQEKGALWTAEENQFTNMSLVDKKRMVGIILTEEEMDAINERKENIQYGTDTLDTLPDFFDWRNQHNKDYMTSVKDQNVEECGSCWAFASLGVLEGVINIYYNNPNLDENLSEQDLISCFEGDGCLGLQLSEFPDLLDYFSVREVCTEECFPYTACDAAGYGNCIAYPGGVPCSDKCNRWQDSSWGIISYTNLEDSLGIVDDIKTALIEKGPLLVGMTIYNDFLSYSSGIYQTITTSYVSNHAAVLVGFGVYDGLEYWIVKNSFGPSWGEDGYFRIAVGDPAGIESQFLFAIDAPNPPSPMQIICTDTDADGYCFWGLSPTKPLNGCPTSCDGIDIPDCDDSDASIFEDCGVSDIDLGSLSVSSEPSGADVSVMYHEGDFNYRGVTPVEFPLDVGDRLVKVSLDGYFEHFETVDIEEGQTTNLFVSLYPSTEIHYPYNNDIFRVGEIIDIIGTTPDEFQSYTVEYGLGEYPSQWFDDGITLTGGGVSPVHDDVLASFDTSFLVDVPNYYTIRVTTYDLSGVPDEVFIRNLYFDPTLKEGWPQYLYDELCSGSWKETGHLEPAVSDIDQDGYDEIIVFKPGCPAKLYAYRHDGSLYWSKEVGTGVVDRFSVSMPVVGDVNNDSFNDIIIAFKDETGLYVRAINHTGDDLWSSSLLADTSNPVLLMADLDLDGNNEIVAKWSEHVFIIDKNGQIISEWDLPSNILNREVTSTPAIGNFDADPEFEIVIANPYTNGGSYEGFLSVYNIDGTEVDGWPVNFDATVFSSPVVGDINNDGEPEIVIATSPSFNQGTGGLYVFNKEGLLLPGWPFGDEYSFQDSPSLTDYDGDGYLEIAISTYDFFNPLVFLLDYNGEIISGWPQEARSAFSTITGDVNNDGLVDIIASWGNGFDPSFMQKGVYAWTFNGNLIEGFPKITEADSFSVVIKDIDDDGNSEIISTSNGNHDFTTSQSKHRASIYVWDLDSVNNGLVDQWPEFHHDLQNTGLYS